MCTFLFIGYSVASGTRILDKQLLLITDEERMVIYWFYIKAKYEFTHAIFNDLFYVVSLE